MQQIENSNKCADINPKISISTSNVDYLNISIKRQKLTVDKKRRPNYIMSTRKPF